MVCKKYEELSPQQMKMTFKSIGKSLKYKEHEQTTQETENF